MNHDEFEDHLKGIPLGQPPPALRARILGEARALRRRQRRGRLVKGMVLGMAMMLIVINLFFERAHNARMTALVGGPSGTKPAVAKAAPLPNALEMRVQLMNELLANGA